MAIFSIALWLLGLSVEAAIILRAVRINLMRRFPYFYSYLIIAFSTSLFTLFVYTFRPNEYATVFWFCFLVSLFAEFGVLVEISDHLFGSYPAIRLLGRTTVVVLSAGFFAFYILASILHAPSKSLALLAFALRMSLTKALVIGAVLLFARLYRLPLTRNVAGLLLGFGLYLGVYISSLAAAQAYGRTLYAGILRFLNPLGTNVCLLIWLVAMWRYEPLSDLTPKPRLAGQLSGESLDYQLTHFDSTLAKLLRK